MKEFLDDRPFQLEKGVQLINNKYKVIGKIGTGSFSSVHAITMIKGQKQVIRAVKVESSNVKDPQISTEVSVLKTIKEGNSQQPGFPQIYEYGYEQNYHYLVMTLLGPNLQSLLKLCGGMFSLKTTLMISMQVLDRIQTLHGLGYVFGDIKPDNFLVGLGAQSPFIYMVDFGKCKRYRNKTNGQHVLYKENVYYSYNPIFGSINSHNNIQASRRDDIESFIYMLTYLKLGKLPWGKHFDLKRNKNQINIGQIKKRLTPQMLCHKLPIEIIDLMYYVRSVQFYEKPDYNYIRKMLYRCLQRQQMDSNIIYDWNKLEEVDFKVYSDFPKIVLKGAAHVSNDYIVESRHRTSELNAPVPQKNQSLQQSEQEQQLILK